MTSAATPEQQPGGLLSRLPKELRGMIYSLVIPPGEIQLFSVRDHLKLARRARAVACDYISLLATCRTVHDEAKAVLFESTEFKIHCSWDLSSSQSIVSLLGKQQWKTWRDFSPEVDVFCHLQHARSISLYVYVNEDTMSRHSWMRKMPVELSSAADLKKLYISIRSDTQAHSVAFQTQADRTMSLLGMMSCKCTITAAMDPSLGKARFEPTSYDAMLSALHGVDKTREVYSERLATLSSSRDSLQCSHDSLFSELRSLQTGLDDNQMEPLWAERSDTRASADELLFKMQDLTCSTMGLQEKLEEVEGEIQGLQEQQEFLLSGRERLLESV